MSGLIDSASAILTASERRVEAAAGNISNASTAGYKRQVAFVQSLERALRPDATDGTLHFASDFAQGNLRETGRPFDLAIFGPALFKLRDGDAFVFSRGGAFRLGDGGRLIDTAGRVLQQASGGDLTVESGAPEILGDGTVVENGIATGSVGLFEPAGADSMSALGGGLFAASPEGMQDASNSIIKRGQLESSNVVISDEMITMMAAVRQAEGGARLVQFYDQLVGQAITTFSRSNK